MENNRRRKIFRFGNFRLALQNTINLKNVLSLFLLIVVSLIISPVAIYLLVQKEYSQYIKSDISQVEEARIGIVFGAGLKNGGYSPSDILQDRVKSAVELYDAGKIKKILMSGDNRFITHNEPDVIIESAKKLGVREFDLQPDYAGRSTYETCYRAKEIFGINKAVLITQEFHLPRAIYICRSLGIEAVGYSADKNIYKDTPYLRLREFFATVNAFWDLFILKPPVVLGEKIYF